MENLENESSYDEREKTNKIKYDELVIRLNLLVSLYPDEKQRPKSIQNEIFEILYLETYLITGISAHIHGPELVGDVYLDKFHVSKYEETMESLEKLRKENKKYVTDEQEKSFVMPKHDINEINLCLFDERKELKKADREKKKKMAEEQIKAENQKMTEECERSNEIQREQERYNQLSFFAKIKRNVIFR